jgi:cell division protein ZapD
VIVYEYPFNERVRTYLRLEHLFERMGTLIRRAEAMDHHFALVTLFEAMDVAARADLKSDVLKDLERSKASFIGFRGNPAIDASALESAISEIEQRYAQLNQQTGKAGQALTENEWLMGIRSRSAIPGGTCEFDAPSYFDWQQRDVSERTHDLASWASHFSPLAHGLSLLLRTLRDSGTAQKVVASKGHYQQNMPTGKTFQLMRLRIDPSQHLIPEISGNRLMVSVRFMKRDAEFKLHPAGIDCGFEVALCS